MIYGYKCRSCGNSRESILRDDTRPCACGGVSRRDYHVSIRSRSAFQPHFSHSVGQYVYTEMGFNESLKRAAERNTIATGVEHQYEMIDPAELAREAPVGDTQIIENRAKMVRDQRIPEPSTTETPCLPAP